ncbi:hypothetical protein F8388_024668 [Cannabis sativa]|uniref:Uncharacterized protein n=2 Tax=Cannabis sativa TaxID=3483 RepID=A0A7J6GBN0_CANSA|nr:hypothetical protein F8388_024668 [Cannabis sativa]
MVVRFRDGGRRGYGKSGATTPSNSEAKSLWEGEGFGKIKHSHLIPPFKLGLDWCTMAIAPNAWEFICDLEVDFGSEENASIVYATIAVDKELQPDKVKRQMSVSDGKLSVHFEAVEARFLRASYSAFVDVLILATKTIEEFGKGMEL